MCACPKATYSTRKRAATAAARVRREHNEVVNHYRCSEGEWHIGHPYTDSQQWEGIIDRMNRSDERWLRQLVA